MSTLLILGGLLACSDDTTHDTATVTDDSGDSGDSGDTTSDCPSAAGTADASWETLTWDDGVATQDIDDQSWSLDGSTPMGQLVLHEAVRFDLEHPALIHGFTVHWSRAPEDPAAPLTAGLFADFGYNGFDFWAEEPLWEGSVCVADISDDGWVTYLLDEPVEVAHPGLVYVAHWRAGEGEPAFSMDNSYLDDGDCGSFDECHSAINAPEETDGGVYFNGLSFPIPYDYLVRLHLTYDESSKTDPVFTLVEDLSLSSRISWGDYDADGWDDVMVNGPRLLRNNGDGTFEDVTESAGISGIGSDGGVWGDFDNDGCLDWFANADSYSRADILLQSNCDGTFTDVTELSGITDQQDYNYCDGNSDNDRSATAASAWWDIDGDGLLDLFMANMICWSDETYYVDTIFHNEGDGTFTEWGTDEGFSGVARASRGAAPADVDADGDVDLFVNNYRLHSNYFYRNLGDGTVDEDASLSNLKGNMDYMGVSYYGHTIGASWGDLDNDGDFDLVAANLAHPRFFHFSDKTQVLLNDGAGVFTDLTEDWETPFDNPSGLRYSETHSVPVLSDVDNDGNLDLGITAVYDGRPSDFYWGQGDGSFVLDAYNAGLDAVENGWGVAAADYDNDGDPDWGTSHGLHRNDLAAGQKGHWLSVKAVGDVLSNREALGATVYVEAGGATWIRGVSGGNGQGCQDSAYLHFGLGDDVTTVDRITVDFPAGGTLVYEGPFDVDQRVWVYESGTTGTGWGPPE